MRHPEFPIDPQFLDRWSPRGFDPHFKLSEAEIDSILEAGRWAPSCANEQPWIFYREKDAASRPLFLSFLTESNQYWVKHASHVLIVCAHKTFAATGKPNKYHAYDTGAAWVSMALQARHMGYYAHCMGGIEEGVIAEKLGIDTNAVEILSAIAIGKQGESAHLYDRHKAQEKPNTRKPQREFVIKV